MENYWNGALLNTVQAALKWAQTITWRGVAPHIHLLVCTYTTGVRLTQKRFRAIAERLLRSPSLPKWSLTIQPRTRQTISHGLPNAHAADDYLRRHPNPQSMPTDLLNSIHSSSLQTY